MNRARISQLPPPMLSSPSRDSPAWGGLKGCKNDSIAARPIHFIDCRKLVRAAETFCPLYLNPSYTAFSSSVLSFPLPYSFFLKRQGDQSAYTSRLRQGGSVESLHTSLFQNASPPNSVETLNEVPCSAESFAKYLVETATLFNASCARGAVSCCSLQLPIRYVFSFSQHCRLPFC